MQHAVLDGPKHYVLQVYNSLCREAVYGQAIGNRTDWQRENVSALTKA